MIDRHVVVAEMLEPRRLLAPLLLKDIPTGTNSSFPSDGLTIGPTMFFTADDGIHGKELWATDGTPEGTRLFKDIRPGSSTSSVFLVGIFNGALYFEANDGIHDGLWRTDGTEGGAIFLTSFSPAPSELTLFNNAAYYTTLSGALWKTDGSPQGTLQLDNTVNYSDLTVGGNRMFFSGTTSQFGDELWTSDGTAQGRSLVKDINPGSDSSSPSDFTYLNGLMFFTASFAGREDLWKSDGTPNGTVIVRPGGPTNIYSVTAMSGRVIFGGLTDATRLWASDGTANGTIPILDVNPVTPVSGYSYPFPTINGTAYFYGSGPAGSGLWKTDGAVSTLLKPFTATTTDTLTQIKAVSSTVYFLITHPSGKELWKTDGTLEGTSLITTVGGSNGALGQVNGQTLLALSQPLPTPDSLGNELWKTDNTPAGTVLLKDINAVRIAPFPFVMTNVNGTLYFAAAGKLWKSDGTEAGTIPFATGPGGTLGLDGGVNLNGIWIYTTLNGIWRSDGTPEGSYLIKNAPIPDASHAQMIASNSLGLVFFADGNGFRNLWRSDGTADGTFAISKPGLGNPTQFFEFNGSVYFTGSVGTPGSLWKTDGTVNGTVQVNSNTSFISSTLVRSAAVMNGRIYFSGCNAANGCELWSTDGTNAGSMIKDINPGSAGSSISRVTASGSYVYFQATDGISGFELWRTDGTPEGTQLVKDMVPGSGSSNPRNLADVNGTLFFSTDAGLWKSDGTDAGTVQLAPFTTFLNEFVQVNNLLFFLIGSPSNQFQKEIWTSDGTPAGTKKLMNFDTGSTPNLELEIINGTAYFRGNGRPEVGGEPWKVSPPTPRSTGPYTLGIGSSIQLDATASSDPDPDETLSFAWDLDNDNTFETTGPTPTFSAANLPAGPYPIKLRVANSFGLISTLSTTVTVRDAHLIGAGGDDHFQVVPSAATGIVDFYENTAPGAPPTFSIPTARISAITVDAGGGHDSLNINSGSFALASTNLEDLTLAGNAHVTLARALYLSALNFGDTSTLDLGRHALVLDSADLGAVTALIQSGRIISSLNLPNGRLAAIFNSDGAGGALYSSFEGISGLSGNEVLVLYTLVGDLNLDRTVSIADFIDLAAHFNQSPATWREGDLNGDQTVTIADFIDLASNFGQSFMPPAAPQAALAAATGSSSSAGPLSRSRSARHHKRHHPRPHLSPQRPALLWPRFRP